MEFANCVSLTVPSTIDINGAIDGEEVTRRIEKVAQMFCQAFGGATVQSARGYYVANDGGLVTESVNIVTAFVAADNDRLPYLSKFMHNVAQTFCKEWAQECVLYTVGNVGYLAFS